MVQQNWRGDSLLERLRGQRQQAAQPARPSAGQVKQERPPASRPTRGTEAQRATPAGQTAPRAAPQGAAPTGSRIPQRAMPAAQQAQGTPWAGANLRPRFQPGAGAMGNMAARKTRLQRLLGMSPTTLTLRRTLGV